MLSSSSPHFCDTMGIIFHSHTSFILNCHKLCIKTASIYYVKTFTLVHFTCLIRYKVNIFYNDCFTYFFLFFHLWKENWSPFAYDGNNAGLFSDSVHLPLKCIRLQVCCFLFMEIVAIKWSLLDWQYEFCKNYQSNVCIFVKKWYIKYNWGQIHAISG